jgi:SEC-C motif-containing protein
MDGINMTLCPCNPDKSYADCCGMFITGKVLPQTPEQLMRSRYSAFTLCNIDYIGRTMHGPAAKDFDKRETENWTKQLEWLGLEVLNTGINDKNGFVEFIAHYAKDGVKERIHEISQFHRKDGKWYYVDGKNPSPHSPVQTASKVGRNEACSCGSGKKFKKCCLGKAN